MRAEGHISYHKGDSPLGNIRDRGVGPPRYSIFNPVFNAFLEENPQ